MATPIEQRVFPMLSYEDVGRAADWITHAFGFEEQERYADDDGTVTHVTLALDGGMVYVDDIGAHIERARAAGATILSELEDNPAAGQRQYRAEDVEGHRWMFAQAT